MSRPHTATDVLGYLLGPCRILKLVPIYRGPRFFKFYSFLATTIGSGARSTFDVMAVDELSGLYMSRAALLVASRLSEGVYDCLVFLRLTSVGTLHFTRSRTKHN